MSAPADPARRIVTDADPGQGNRWADCVVCVEVPTVTGWALGKQDRCPVHGRQPFPDGKQSQSQPVRDPDEFTPDPSDDWRPPQEMVDDLVEAWHTQPDQLLDDFMRDLLRRWAAAGRLLPSGADTRTEWTWRHNRFIAEHDASTDRARAERNVSACARSFPRDDVGVVHRTVLTWPDGSTHVGPWLPVPTTEGS